MVGDSAGGHILSLFSSMCTNPDFAANFDFKVPEGFVPKAIALNCAMLDMDMAKKGLGGTTMQLMEEVLLNKGTNEELQLVNPILYVNEKFPPCFIMTCNEDFLKDHPESFKKKLDVCKVPYVYKFYGDEENKLGHVFHLDIRNETECEYFKSFIK